MEHQCSPHGPTMQQCMHGSNSKQCVAGNSAELKMHCAACAGKVRAAFLEAAKPLLPLLLATVLKTLEEVSAPAGVGTEDTDLPQAAAGKAPGCGSLLAAPVHNVGLTRCGLLEVGPRFLARTCLWRFAWLGAKRAQALTTSACQLAPLHDTALLPGMPLMSQHCS